MSLGIKPGQTVLAAALPVPLNVLDEMKKFVERVYGTGDTMLDFSSGDVIRVVAPKDGFGPVKRSRNIMPPRDPEDEETMLRSVRVTDETASMTLEAAQEVVLNVTEAMLTWFEIFGGINYVTTEFVTADEASAPYQLTIQKGGNPSAHDLRLAAEQKHTNLVAEIGQTDQLAGIIERTQKHALAGTIPNPKNDSISELIAKAIAEHLNPTAEAN